MNVLNAVGYMLGVDKYMMRNMLQALKSGFKRLMGVAPVKQMSELEYINICEFYVMRLILFDVDIGDEVDWRTLGQWLRMMRMRRAAGELERQ